MEDSSNQYAPIIEFLHEASALEPSQAEMLDQMRANLAIVGPVSPIDNAVDRPVRGFGKGYELFAEDLHTMIEVEHLVYGMKEQGIEVSILSFACLLYLIREHDVRFIHQWMLDMA
jgi:pyroglutamyl-peptidase